MRGRVIRVFGARGYGFIAGEDGEKYHFYLGRRLSKARLQPGDEVEFEFMRESRGGMCASVQNVILISRREEKSA